MNISLLRRLSGVTVVVLLTAFFIQSAGAADRSGSKAVSLKGKGPIEITSDRLDAYNEEKLVVFSGNVVATQADKVIRADQLFVYYKKKKGTKGQKSKDFGQEAGELDRIEARGNVQVTQGKKVVTGEHGVFYNDEQKIVMTGNPVMREGDNILKGERIIVLLDEDRGIVESSKEKRVTATIYPDESKNKKR
ncbi:MAG: hypothetical protein KBG12_04530 [Syntrophobacterales bacterium]|nr:hypothetical protein [Syntrophobacterales bacterium]